MAEIKPEVEKVEVRKTQKEIFIEAIQAANTVLLETPEVIDLQHDKDRFFWTATSSKSNKARAELRKGLQEMWQNGAFNFEQIAKAMRIDTQTVQALMDEEFINKYGL